MDCPLLVCFLLPLYWLSPLLDELKSKDSIEECNQGRPDKGNKWFTFDGLCAD